MNFNKTLTMAVLFLCLSGQANSAQSLNCHTPRNEKTFEMNAQTVVFVDEDFHADKPIQRRLASILNVKTELIRNGMTKTLMQNGQKHIIHIENQDHFSSLDDYIIIRSREGHEIIYPLECTNV